MGTWALLLQTTGGGSWWFTVVLQSRPEALGGSIGGATATKSRSSGTTGTTDTTTDTTYSLLVLLVQLLLRLLLLPQLLLLLLAPSLPHLTANWWPLRWHPRPDPDPSSHVHVHTHNHAWSKASPRLSSSWSFGWFGLPLLCPVPCQKTFSCFLFLLFPTSLSLLPFCLSYHTLSSSFFSTSSCSTTRIERAFHSFKALDHIP